MSYEQHRSQERRHPARAYTRQQFYAPEDLQRSIAARLRAVCTYCREADFLAFVRRVAHIQWKYEQRARSSALLRDR
jgi:hypothetical protein